MRRSPLVLVALVSLACSPPPRRLDDACGGKAETTFFRDADGDGFGNPTDTKSACAVPDGYVAKGGDCDDTNPAVHPGAAEVACNGVDDDCDATTPDDPDRDHDGVGACDGDCDDADPAVHPGAAEACNGKDDNCDGQIDEGLEHHPFWPDADGDGFGNAQAPALEACAAPPGFVVNDGDCDDSKVTVHPGAAEVTCNGVDDDCDPSTPDAPDVDHDGYTTCAGDCDDLDPAVHPGAAETCNGKDDDCNGRVDDGLPTFTFHHDADHDGYGAAAAVTACGASGDLVMDGTDCDDSDPTVHPGAAERCDGRDRDCDGHWAPVVPEVCPTIQSAVDLAGPGDTVSVGPGTYRENVVLRGIDLTLVATAGASRTTIDGSSTSAPTVTVESSETAATVIDGFTIQGGAGWVDASQCQGGKCPRFGGGLLVKNASPTLQNLVVTHNDIVETNGWTYGGGVAFIDSDSRVKRSRIVANSADYYGGGVYLDNESHVTLEQTLVGGNHGGDGGGIAVYYGQLDLTNVILSGNVGGTAGGVFCQGCTLGATNVTGYENSSSYEGGFLDVDDGGHAVVTNSAIASNSGSPGASIAVKTDSGSSATVTFSDLVPSDGGASVSVDSTDISRYPLFVQPAGDWSTYDLHPSRSPVASPLIDSGDPAVLDADGTRSDMGAYGGPAGSW